MELPTDYFDSFEQIVTKLRKKNLLRKPNYADAADSFSQLLQQIKRLTDSAAAEQQHQYRNLHHQHHQPVPPPPPPPPHLYAGFCCLAVARCEQAMKNSVMEAQALAEASYIFAENQLHAHNYKMLSWQDNTTHATDCYLLAIKIYRHQRKFNIAAALYYELATILQQLGSLVPASEYFESCGDLLQQDSLLQAINALQHAVDCKITLRDYKSSCALLIWVIKLAAEQQSLHSSLYTASQTALSTTVPLATSLPSFSTLTSPSSSSSASLSSISSLPSSPSSVPSKQSSSSSSSGPTLTVPTPSFFSSLFSNSQRQQPQTLSSSAQPLANTATATTITTEALSPSRATSSPSSSSSSPSSSAAAASSASSSPPTLPPSPMLPTVSPTSSSSVYSNILIESRITLILLLILQGDFAQGRDFVKQLVEDCKHSYLPTSNHAMTHNTNMTRESSSILPNHQHLLPLLHALVNVCNCGNIGAIRRLQRELWPFFTARQNELLLLIVDENSFHQNMSLLQSTHVAVTTSVLS